MLFSQPSTLWLIGGTSEGLKLAEQLQKSGIPTRVTVTTEAACQRYDALPDVGVQALRFTSDDGLMNWIERFHITGILDASHPFATVVSARAMRMSQTLNLPYLRFEREATTAVQSEYITEIDPGTTYLSHGVLDGKKVLLTVGSQSLSEFAQWHDCAELFARILPSETAIQLAYQAGFSRDRLIALQPPLSFELESALWRHWDISLVITKASGQAGGEDIKRQVATALQIPLFVIKRPPIHYLRQTQSIATAMRFAQQVTHSVSPHSAP